jgi:ADP-heptose:LPS heptosyltransferase
VVDHLQIYDPRERLLVGCADTALSALRALTGWLPSRKVEGAAKRILLLRLERIGDLIMTLGAIEAVRDRLPDARIHLVVGSWNEPVARLLTTVDSYEVLDVPWLARQKAGAPKPALLRAAWRWRKQRFDVALNFEPDIRSNLMLALSGAPQRLGYASGGGGALLTSALSYVPADHTATNSLRLVESAFPAAGSGRPGASRPTLRLPDEARQRAADLLGRDRVNGVLVGLHASAGRRIKQWEMERFAEVGVRLSRAYGATLVLTGTVEERPLVDRIAASLPTDVPRIDLAVSMDLPVLAGVLERLNLFITCDTGPMHLAASVGTPTVALFGPSDPARYGPLNERATVVTADLWCRPCNRVRRPPDRCAAHVPDCLDGIDVDTVFRAASGLLSTSS